MRGTIFIIPVLHSEFHKLSSSSEEWGPAQWAQSMARWPLDISVVLPRAAPALPSAL